jgi:hypothetical protein
VGVLANVELLPTRSLELKYQRPILVRIRLDMSFVRLDRRTAEFRCVMRHYILLKCDPVCSLPGTACLKNRSEVTDHE